MRSTGQYWVQHCSISSLITWMMGENVSSASLLMTKLRGANDTVPHAGRNNLMHQYMLEPAAWRETWGSQWTWTPPSSVHLWQTRLRVAWAALDKVLSRSRQRKLPLLAALIKPHLMHWVRFHSTGEIQNYRRVQQGVKAPQHPTSKEILEY